MHNIREWLCRSFALDVRALAVGRVLVAIIVLVDLFRRLGDFTAHYTDGGILPKAVLATEGLWPYAEMVSLHMVSGSWWWQMILFSLTALAAVFLMFGYYTRFAAMAVWYLLLSLHTSQPLVLQRGDAELLAILFWSMFVPLGAVWSVDAALREGKRVLSNTVVLSVASAALTLQVLYVYFFAYWHKSSSVWRNELLGVQYAFSLDQYATDIARWLLQFPELLQGLTFLVLLVQILALPIVLLPLRSQWPRIVMLGILASTHVAYIFTLHIGFFPFVSLIGLVLLLPEKFWDWLWQVLRPRQSVSIYYDADCGFCRRSVWLITTLALVRVRRIAVAQSDAAIYTAMEREYSWVVVDDEGVQHYHFGGGVAIARASVLLRPLVQLAYVPGVWRLGDWVYGLVAHNRSWIPTPRRPGSFFVESKTKGVLALGVQCILFYVLISVTFWNMYTLGVARVPEVQANMLQVLGLQQHWGVFSPTPRTEDGWYRQTATTSAGERVDVFLGAAPVDGKPDHVAALYQNQRWRKFLSSMFYPEIAWVRPSYAQWLCRDWNTNHPDSQIEAVKVEYMLERTTPDGEWPVIPLTLYEAECQ